MFQSFALLSLTIPLMLMGTAVATPQGLHAAPPAQADTASTQKRAGIQREILEASLAWNDAVLRGDIAEMDRRQTSDFVTVQETPQGVAIIARDRQKQVLRPPQADAPKVERRLEQVRVRSYGDAAILTGLATLRRQVSPGRVEMSRAAITEVWVRQEGTWRIAHFQPANVPPPAAPKK